jgi:hypothetical protein
MTILGSLIIHSNTPVPDLPLQELHGLTRREGRHVAGKYNGGYREFFDVSPLEVMVPQRYKRLSILASPGYGPELAEALSTLDSQLEGRQQRDKLALLMTQVPGDWVASVNVVNAGADGQATSGAFFVLNSGLPMYIALVFDSNGGSVQLVWASFDFKASLRNSGALNYSFYPMPDRGSLFIPSHSVCSKWWRNTRAFSGQPYNQVKAANAIEQMLFKPLTEHGLR